MKSFNKEHLKKSIKTCYRSCHQLTQRTKLHEFKSYVVTDQSDDPPKNLGSQQHNQDNNQHLKRRIHPLMG